MSNTCNNENADEVSYMNLYLLGRTIGIQNDPLVGVVIRVFKWQRPL